MILETAPEWQQNPAQLGNLYIQSGASAGATGAGATTSFSSSASAAAGSNALTTSVRYSPVVRRDQSAGHGACGTTSTTSNTAIAATSANAIPLSAFTQVSPTTESLSINHQGQFPSVTVSFNLAPKASLGTAITGHRQADQASQFSADDSG